MNVVTEHGEHASASSEVTLLKTTRLFKTHLSTASLRIGINKLSALERKYS